MDTMSSKDSKASRATAYFTICAGNYLAFARSLGRSLAAVHPGSPFTIWLLDPDPPTGDLGPFRVRSIGEVLTEAELAEFRLYYDLLELANSEGIDLRITKITSAEQARRSPSGFGVFSLVHDGELIEDHYISKTRFSSILSKRHS